MRKQNKKAWLKLCMTSVVSAFQKRKKSAFQTSQRSPAFHAKDVLRNWWLNLSRICNLILRIFIDNLINGFFPFIVCLKASFTKNAKSILFWNMITWPKRKHMWIAKSYTYQHCGCNRILPVTLCPCRFTRTRMHTCTCARTCVCYTSVLLLFMKKSICLAWIVSIMIVRIRLVLMCYIRFWKPHFKVW